MANVHRFPDPLLDSSQNDPAGKSAPLALVFTDMVGSSAAKRAASLGADAQERDRAYLEGIQSKHLRLIRDTIANYNGTEIMTIGDSFFLTFADPVDAIRCSAAIQQRLRDNPIDTPSGPLKLRIGIHIGTPEFFENSWHGTDVDTAARAESAGSPTQIVVTESARKAMGEPLGIRFTPLGTFSLKGVGDVKLWDADYDNHGPRPAALLSNETRKLQRSVLWSIVAVLLIAAIGLTGRYLWLRHQQTNVGGPIGVKDSIILADFVNQTGDPVFDTSLTQALTIQLQQSPILNLVSQQHVRQSMQYLGKSKDDILTPAIAREIGEREGVKAYLTGTIAKLGSSYLITVTAQNTSTGDDIASEQAQAPDKEHVLEALDKVSTAMRARLGETLSSIQKLDTPLGQATTPSLDAFRAYALGDVEHEKGFDVPDAEGHYKQAVEIDPNFAMAWARLGVVAINSGQPGKSMDYFTKAFDLSKNISERERLYIAGHYYQNVSGDIQKTVDTLQLATRTYPLNFDNAVNLGVALGNYGKVEESVEQYKRAADLQPDDAVAQLDLLGVQIQLDRLQDAAATLATAERLKIADGTQVMSGKYQLAFLNNDPAAMQRALAAVVGRPDEYQLTQQNALTEEFLGRYKAADAIWKRAEIQAVNQKAPDAQAYAMLMAISGRGLALMCGDTAAEVKAALAIDKSKPTLTQAVYTAAICNDEKNTLPLLASLQRAYPEDTRINQMYAPQIRAIFALAQHKPDEALRQLEGSQKFDLVTWAPYLRGLAYLDLHDGPNAIVAFQSALKYKGNALIGVQNYPQSQLGLARAYALTGDKAAAKKTYEALFTTWKNADPDLPQFLAAKKEHATLSK